MCNKTLKAKNSTPTYTNPYCTLNSEQYENSMFQIHITNTIIDMI